MRNQQEAQRAEQQRMKRITLNMDFRDEDPADNGESKFSYYDQQQPNTSTNHRTRVNANYSNLLLERNPNIVVVSIVSGNPSPPKQQRQQRQQRQTPTKCNMML